MKVWITKYALTRGIIETDVPVCDVGGGTMIEAGKLGFFHGADWHTSRENANRRIEIMIENRIKGLKNQIAKLEKIREEL